MIAFVGTPLALVGFTAAAAFAIGVAVPGTQGAGTSRMTTTSSAASTADVPTAAAALAFARAQLGKPYVWGGTGPVGFDCSGLTQAAWRAAGVTIARTSEAQWQTLPHVPLDALMPGDLVFFNSGEFRAGLPGHVGIYLGNASYIDAPHTGAFVRVDQLNHTLGVVGAARPMPAGSQGAQSGGDVER